jgi:hypothetical protein
VPFGWTLRLAAPWLFTVSILLAIYYVWDRRAYARETAGDRREDRLALRPLRDIGNGPNFMVRSIAEARGLRCQAASAICSIAARY